MKKTLSFILALVMLLGCMSVTAFAAEPTKVVWDESEIHVIHCRKGAFGEMIIDNNTLKGITVECVPYADGTGWGGKILDLREGGTVTFTSSVGAISKIEITAEIIDSESVEHGNCPGWSLNGSKLTWQGEPVETVTLTAGKETNVIKMSQIVFTIGEEDTEEDTFLTSFTLNKKYYHTYTGINLPCANETLTFTISPITANAPAFANNGVVSMTVTADEDVGSAEIALPTVTAAGEYWYTLKENAGNTAGVTYNGNTYYLHLITDCKSGEYGVVSAQLHTTAPKADGTYQYDDEKIAYISNTCAAGELTIYQETLVNGEHDSDDEFTATVTFTLPEGTVFSNNISYGNLNRNGTITPDDWANGSVTVDFDMKDGEYVIFTGLPDGTTYTIKQKTDASAMGYGEATYTLDNPDETGDSADSNGVAGTIGDNSDTVTISNEKNIPIDVGVMLENGAFIVLGLGALALGAWLVLSKRKERAYDAE